MAKNITTTTRITAATRAEVKRLRSELALATDEYYNVLHCMCERDDRLGYNAAREASDDATLAAMQANRQAIRNTIDALLGKTAAQAAA
jgi:hypothetical protein